MTVSNGDVLKLVVEGLLDDGTIVQNVFYLLANLAAPQADQSILNDLETWVESAYTNILAQMVDTCQFNDITCDIIAWDGAKWETTYHVGTEAVQLSPTAIADDLPNQIAPFATFNTVRPKSKGRKFLWAFSENETTGSHLTSGALTNIVAFAADCLDTIILAPFNELVPGIVRKGVNDFLEFQSATVTNVVGTQRRRRPGVGI